jgi:hypothetical protein
VDILTKQYNYIKSCINDKRQIVDKKLKSPLEFQYHYTSFILSSIMMDDTEYLEQVVQYYLSISKEKMKPSNDFNVALLLLALENDKNNLLSEYKEVILKSIYHNNDEELYKLNNNFRALRLVGLLLEDKITQEKLNTIKIDKEIEWVLNLQFEDGFFPDSNMKYEVEKNRGVPHLIYHTKITMCLGIAYRCTQDSRLLETFNKAIDVLLDLSIENYYFFYGRSTNALFGYGSFYLTLMMAYKFNNDAKYLKLAEDVLMYLQKFQHDDGHVSINLNQDDNNRLGFDAYMYDLVYNTYSNAMFLYANSIKKDLIPLELNEEKKKIPNIRVYKDSGFVVHEYKSIKYCFNYKGHQDSLKHRFDSRVSPFSLLYFQKDGQNLLPAVGYKPSGILSLVEKKFYFKKIYARWYQLVNYDWLPLFSGNSFFYEKDGMKFYPFRCVKMLKLRNILILKFESKARKLFSKKETFDKFVISIKLLKEPKCKIIFYEKVDELFFTYREIQEQNNFEYSFSKEYKELKTLSIETSYKKADLHRCRFEDIEKLEIKVKTSDS